MKSLLEKAKCIKTQPKKQELPEGMQDLALGWCRGEVNLTQIARVLNLPNTGHQTYAKIALALKKYLNENYKI